MHSPVITRTCTWSTCSSKFALVSVIICSLREKGAARAGPRQLVGHVDPPPDQVADLGVDLGELAPVDGDRLRARGTRRLARPQAVHERPGVLQRETRRKYRRMPEQTLF